MSTPLQTFVDRLVREHGTAGAIAKALGMSLSAFSRGVRLEGSLGVDKCLRLAEFSGESPSKVLRLAGKGDIADLIEKLYGPARAPISDLDADLIALESDVKRQLLRLVHGLIGAPTRRR